jgi:hypothetical protein
MPCRFHGGRSTGPLTEDRKASALAAMREGRRRRYAGQESARRDQPRKSGSGWITPRMREERAIEALQRFGAHKKHAPDEVRHITREEQRRPPCTAIRINVYPIGGPQAARIRPNASGLS